MTFVKNITSLISGSPKLSSALLVLVLIIITGIVLTSVQLPPVLSQLNPNMVGGANGAPFYTGNPVTEDLIEQQFEVAEVEGIEEAVEEAELGEVQPVEDIEDVEVVAEDDDIMAEVEEDELTSAPMYMHNSNILSNCGVEEMFASV